MVYTMNIYVHGDYRDEGHARPIGAVAARCHHVLPNGDQLKDIWIRRLPPNPPPDLERATLTSIILAMEKALNHHGTLSDPSSSALDITILSASAYAIRHRKKWVPKMSKENGWGERIHGSVGELEHLDLHRRASKLWRRLMVRGSLDFVLAGESDVAVAKLHCDQELDQIEWDLDNAA